jgi:hypothetical protein
VEGGGRGLFLRQYPSICLQELRKTTSKFSQQIWSPDRDFNQESPEYEVERQPFDHESEKKYILSVLCVAGNELLVFSKLYRSHLYFVLA